MLFTLIMRQSCSTAPRALAQCICCAQLQPPTCCAARNVGGVSQAVHCCRVIGRAARRWVGHSFKRYQPAAPWCAYGACEHRNELHCRAGVGRKRSFRLSPACVPAAAHPPTQASGCARGTPAFRFNSTLPHRPLHGDQGEIGCHLAEGC